MANMGNQQFGVGLTFFGRDNLSRVAHGVGGAMTGFAGGLDNINMSAGLLNTQLAGVARTIGTAFTSSIINSLGAAAQLETKLLFIGAIGGKSMKAVNGLADEFVRMSSTLPLSAMQLADVGIAAAQMGVYSNFGKDAVLQLALASSQLAAASRDLNEEQAAEAIGKLLNVFALSSDFVSNSKKMASALNALAFTSQATQGVLADITLRAGALAKAVGITAPEVLGLAAAATDLGVDWTVTATGLGRGIGAMSSETGRFAAAMGVSEKNLQGFIRKDALSAFIEFLRTVKDAGPDAAKVLASVGLAKPTYMPVFLGLAANLDLVSKHINTATAAWEKGTLVESAFMQMTKGVEKAMETLQGSVENVGIEVGRMVLPFQYFALNVGVEFVSLFFDIPKVFRFVGIAAALLTGGLFSLSGVLLSIIGQFFMMRFFVIEAARSIWGAEMATWGLVKATKELWLHQIDLFIGLQKRLATGFVFYLKQIITATKETWAYAMSQLASLKSMSLSAKFMLFYNRLWKGLQSGITLVTKQTIIWASTSVKAIYGVTAALNASFFGTLLKTGSLMEALKKTIDLLKAKVLAFFGVLSAGAGGLTAGTKLSAFLGLFMNLVYVFSILGAAVIILMFIFKTLKKEFAALWSGLEVLGRALLQLFGLIWDVAKEIIFTALMLLYPAIAFLGAVLVSIGSVAKFVGAMFILAFEGIRLILLPFLMILKIIQGTMWLIGQAILMFLSPTILTPLNFLADLFLWLTDAVVDFLIAIEQGAKAEWAKEIGVVFNELSDAWKEVEIAAKPLLSMFTQLMGGSKKAAKETSLFKAVVLDTVKVISFFVRGIAGFIWLLVYPIKFLAFITTKAIKFGKWLFSLFHGSSKKTNAAMKVFKDTLWILLHPVQALMIAFDKFGKMVMDYVIDPIVNGLKSIWKWIDKVLSGLSKMTTGMSIIKTAVVEGTKDTAVGVTQVMTNPLQASNNAGNQVKQILKSLWEMVPKFAEGGIVGQTMLAGVGEVPEAIVPLGRLESMLNRATNFGSMLGLNFFTNALEDIGMGLNSVFALVDGRNFEQVTPNIDIMGVSQNNEISDRLVERIVSALSTNLADMLSSVLVNLGKTKENTVVSQGDTSVALPNVTIPVTVKIDEHVLAKAIKQISQDDMKRAFNVPTSRLSGVTA